MIICCKENIFLLTIFTTYFYRVYYMNCILVVFCEVTTHEYVLVNIGNKNIQ